MSRSITAVANSLSIPSLVILLDDAVQAHVHLIHVKKGLQIKVILAYIVLAVCNKLYGYFYARFLVEDLAVRNPGS